MRVQRCCIGVGLLLSLAACQGVLTAPAIQRLDPVQQAQVDQMWNNMLADPDRLNRELLLDVIIASDLHAAGVDRASYHAEKDHANGVVVMDVKFDRSKPLDDWFFIEIRDRKNHVVRKEHYSGDEVLSHQRELWQPTTEPTSMPTTLPLDGEKLAGQRRWIRWGEIMAATQPATQP